MMSKWDTVADKWDTDGIQHAMDNIKRAEVANGAYWSDPQEDEVLQDNIKYDSVSYPKHYGQGDIECIEYIADFLSYDEYVGYLRGNIAKYLHRWRFKNGLEDLKKAQWYLVRLVQEVEYGEDHTDKAL